VSAQAPPIDVEQFRAAMRASGIEEIVIPMLELFAQEAPKGMDALEAAMAAGDLEAVNRAAHALKSSAGNVRARELAGLLQELESAARAKDAAKAGRLFESAKDACTAALGQLAELGINA